VQLEQIDFQPGEIRPARQSPGERASHILAAIYSPPTLLKLILIFHSGIGGDGRRARAHPGGVQPGGPVNGKLNTNFTEPGYIHRGAR